MCMGQSLICFIFWFCAHCVISDELVMYVAQMLLAVWGGWFGLQMEEV